jgi:hypothetical protein
MLSSYSGKDERFFDAIRSNLAQHAYVSTLTGMVKVRREWCRGGV